MKKLKKLAVMLITGIMAFTFAACAPVNPDGPNNGLEEEIDASKTQLYVFNYGGGFGYDWLIAAKERFESAHAEDVLEEGKKGVQIIIEHAKQSMTGTEVKQSKNDVFFTEGVNYYSLINDGALLDLTEAIKKPLSDIDADDTRSVFDKYSSDQKEYFGVGDSAETYKYYGVPHYAGYWGIIYNKQLFDDRGLYFRKDQSAYDEYGVREMRFVGKAKNVEKSLGPDGQTGVIDGVDYSLDDGLPATYDEFFALCDYIALDLKLIPITWNGSNSSDYLQTFTYTLAVDYDGKTDIMKNYSLKGTAPELGTVNGAGEFVPDSTPTELTPETGYEIYRSASRYNALKFLNNLVIDDVEHNKYHNENAFKSSYSHMNAQEDFLYGGIDGVTTSSAMLIDGVWWQMEASSTFRDMQNKYGDEYTAKNRNFALMPLPKANSTKASETANSAVKQTMYDAQFSLAYIKSNIADYKKNIAIEFLRFVNTQESLVEYTKITDTTKALQYTLSDAEKEGLSEFGKSVINLQSRSEIVYPYVKDATYLNNASMFRPSQMFYSQVTSSRAPQWAAGEMRDRNTDVKTYFEGMYNYYKNTRWTQLVK